MLAMFVEGFLVSRVSCYVCIDSVARVALRELRSSRKHFAVRSRKCERFCGTSVQISWKVVVL